MREGRERERERGREVAFVVVGFFFVSFSFFDETRGKRACVCEAAVFIFVELLRETSVLGGGGGCGS